MSARTSSRDPRHLPDTTKQPDEPLEERVQIVEEKVERLFADLSRREDEFRQTLREEIARTGTEAMKLADERDRALRAFISAQLAGNVRRGAIGAFLLALGVIVAVIGNLVG